MPRRHLAGASLNINIYIFLIVVCLFQYASSLKVALLPYIAGSHPLSMDIISQHLTKRGHTVMHYYL